MTAIASIVLRAGRERPVQQRHPWIFSGAIASVQGNPGRGDEIDVRGADGTWLARGTWSSASQIRVRLFTWDEHERLDDTLLQRQLQRAFAARTSVAGAACTSAQACRLVYAESDGLPGLIVDRYGAYLVIQLLTQGMAARARQICHLLTSLAGPDGIYERSDAEVREKEDLPISEGVCQGSEPPTRLTVQAAPLHTEPPIAPRLLVDIRGGQKTGTYLDQAVNRVRVAAYCQGAEVLDGFCYSGGFAVYAALAGAQHITAIDSSAAALEQVREHFALNRLQTPLETIDGNVFRLLRRYRQEERRFDVVILDPPKFAHHQGQVERATRGYKDINMLAMHLLRPGGVLATFSCSGLVSPDLFQKVVFGAAIDARRDVQIIERLTQAPDHPVLVSFPESDYLKGLICRVW